MYVIINELLDDDGELLDDDYLDDNSPMFDMMNNNYSSPYNILKYMFGDNFKEYILKYLNFD